MSVTRSRLASWVAIRLAPITWSFLAHQLFSTVQTSTSLTSRFVYSFVRLFGEDIQRRPILCIPSRDWLTKAEQFYAAHCFYDENQARYPGRVSPRHQQVWPELLADLKRAGCQNYSIYLRDTELFAYMEVDDFQRYLEIMAASRPANAGRPR